MGRKDEILERVRAIAEPLATSEGLELVDLELAGVGAHTTLRLFIDRVAPAQPAVPSADELAAITEGLPRTGVTLDDCANLSRSVSAALDVEDPIAGRYELEVSSPGLDRPLRTPAHFERFSGQKIRVKTYAPLSAADNRKTFIGKLIGYQDGTVLMDVDGVLCRIPHDQIAKANVEYDFGSN